MPINAEQNQIDNQNNQDPNMVQGPNNQAPAGGQNLAGSGNTGVASGGAASGRVANFSSGSQAGSGSGRYTNLQKYIGANQGATDRLYQGINQRINQTNQPSQKQAQTEAEKVKQGISQGNQTLERGTGYLNQLNQQDFNAQDFAADQNRLDDYSKFRTGQAVDVGTLNTQNTTAQAATMNAQNVVQNRLNQVGTEAGRFDLLKETFGGRNLNRPTYSAGQQRLDQLFLQSGSGDKVGQLQNDLRANVNNLGQNIQNLKGMTAEQIKAIQDQQAGLSGNIQNRANTLETGYIDTLQGQVAGVNSARDAERAKYRGFTDQLIRSGRGENFAQNLDQDLFNEARLRAGEQTFNFFKNPTLDKDQFLNINTQNANDYRDIAKKENVDYYSALSKLAGINNSKLANVGSLIDQSTGQLNRAATLKQGEGSLRSGLDKVQDDFIKQAAGITVAGEGVDKGTDSWFGNGADAHARIAVNLKDYLDGKGYTSVAGEAGQMSNVEGAMYLYNPALMIGSDILAGLGGGDVMGNIADGIAGLGGTASGSQGAANARAKDAFIANMLGTLENTGFNNYLGMSGVKDTSDIQRSKMGTEQAQKKHEQEGSLLPYIANFTADPSGNIKKLVGEYQGIVNKYQSVVDTMRQRGVNPGIIAQKERQIADVKKQIDHYNNAMEQTRQQVYTDYNKRGQDLTARQQQLHNDFYSRLGITPPAMETSGPSTGRLTNTSPVYKDPAQALRNRFQGK